MMLSYFEMVGEFHKRFMLPSVKTTFSPHQLDEETMQYRINFLQEELTELIDADADEDIAMVADALADIVYVALGTAQLMGLPFDEIFSEVQRTNMLKERADGATDPRSKRRHSYDVVKPEGWTAPDIRSIINAAYPKTD